VDVFWRGVQALDPPEFKLRGGTEVGFMSLTKSREVAQEAALKLVAAEMKSKVVECKLDSKLDDDDDGGQTDADKHHEYLALAPSMQPSSPTQKRMDAADVPILLFKLQPTEVNVPADLTFLSPTPEEAECVYPPGVYLEQRKETMEYVRIDQSHGGKGFKPADLQAKIVEANLHFARTSMKPPKKAVEEKANAPAAAPPPPPTKGKA